jgi:hypothetical protein
MTTAPTSWLLMIPRGEPLGLCPPIPLDRFDRLLPCRFTFVDHVTMPDGTPVEPGAEFKKTWRLRNSSQVAWPTGLELSYVSGDLIPLSPSQPIPAAKPGDHVEVSVNLRVPDPASRAAKSSLSSVWSIVSRTAGGEPETHLQLSAHVTVASMSPDPQNPASRSTTEPPAKPPVSALKSAARRDSSAQKSEKDLDTPSTVSSTTSASTPSGPGKTARQVVALR